jgi:hypothetical protein
MNRTFTAKDSYNNPIILEWKKVQGHTDELAQTIKNIASILVPSYTQTEVKFAQEKPEDAATDFMLKSLAPVLKQNPVDWGLFEQKVRDYLTQFFATMDWKAGSGAEDIHFFVVAKDAKNNPLGAIQFFSTPDFEKGTFKSALFGILSFAHNQSIEELLMASIFKLQPDSKRIFLHTRSTNIYLIDLYKKWGFAEFSGKLSSWTDLEYFADQKQTLQNIAKKFIT